MEISERLTDYLRVLPSRKYVVIPADEPTIITGMIPILNYGDIVLIDYLTPIKEGDLVWAKWGDQKFDCGFRFVSPNPNNDPHLVKLFTMGTDILPVVVRKRDAQMYKVLSHFRV